MYTSRLRRKKDKTLIVLSHLNDIIKIKNVFFSLRVGDESAHRRFFSPENDKRKERKKKEFLGRPPVNNSVKWQVGVNRWKKGGGLLSSIWPLLGKKRRRKLFLLSDLEKFAPYLVLGGRAAGQQMDSGFPFIFLFRLIFFGGKAKRYHNKKEWGGG